MVGEQARLLQNRSSYKEYHDQLKKSKRFQRSAKYRRGPSPMIFIAASITNKAKNTSLKPRGVVSCVKNSHNGCESQNGASERLGNVM